MPRVSPANGDHSIWKMKIATSGSDWLVHDLFLGLETGTSLVIESPKRPFFIMCDLRRAKEAFFSSMP
jgi:hypothetical protein